MRGSKFKFWGTLILVQFSGNNPISWVLRCPILTHTQIGANHPKINHLSIENGDLGIPNFKNFPYSYLYPQYISMISKLYSHILVYIAIISPIMVHKTTTLCSLNHYFCWLHHDFPVRHSQKTITLKRADNHRLERGRWSSVSLMIYMNFMCIAYRTASRTIFFVLYIIYITYIYISYLQHIHPLHHLYQLHLHRMHHQHQHHQPQFHQHHPPNKPYWA